MKSGRWEKLVPNGGGELLLKSGRWALPIQIRSWEMLVKNGTWELLVKCRSWELPVKSGSWETFAESRGNPDPQKKRHRDTKEVYELCRFLSLPQSTKSHARPNTETWYLVRKNSITGYGIHPTRTITDP